MSGRKQFDVDAALERAMTAFWEGGFAATSLDTLTTVTGLGRGLAQPIRGYGRPGMAAPPG